MPAVEEEEGGMKRALVSPLKRKTGGIIEMWITDESYASPVKEAKVNIHPPGLKFPEGLPAAGSQPISRAKGRFS